jgi:hypothetical protein
MEKIGFKSILFVAASVFAISGRSFAQQGGAASSMSQIEPRNAVSVILMSGLVGGVLGLSTLSFYDRPQDNIRNITIGAGVGMISAALFMTYTVSQTQSPATRSLQWAPKVDGDGAGLVAQLHF